MALVVMKTPKIGVSHHYEKQFEFTEQSRKEILRVYEQNTFTIFGCSYCL